MDKQLTNYIAKFNLISKDVCDSIIEEIEKSNWETHHWYSHHNEISHSYEEKELEVTMDIPEYISETINLFLKKSFSEYKNILSELYSEDSENFFNMIGYWSKVRFNRYLPGTMMRPHYDHIHSLFDGKIRGIPVLSSVGCLNDDYEGGEFIFYDDFKVEMNAGDILLFPSNFLYPHRVQEVTSGTRYSFVNWAW